MRTGTASFVTAAVPTRNGTNLHLDEWPPCGRRVESDSKARNAPGVRPASVASEGPIRHVAAARPTASDRRVSPLIVVLALQDRTAPGAGFGLSGADRWLLGFQATRDSEVDPCRRPSR